MNIRVLLAATALMAGTAHAQSFNAPYGLPATSAQPATEPGYPSWDQARIGHYRSTLQAVRKEALKLQAVDGGRLTPEHIGYFQARIDAADRELAYELGARDGSMFAHSPGRHP